MFSSLKALELSGTAISPSVVSWFSDWDGQAMVRQDRGFDPILWISSVADCFEGLIEMSSRYQFGEGGVPHPTYTRVEDQKFCIVIGYLVLANCIYVVLILASSA